MKPLRVTALMGSLVLAGLTLLVLLVAFGLFTTPAYLRHLLGT